MTNRQKIGNSGITCYKLVACKLATKEDKLYDVIKMNGFLVLLQNFNSEIQDWICLCRNAFVDQGFAKYLMCVMGSRLN